MAPHSSWYTNFKRRVKYAFKVNNYDLLSDLGLQAYDDGWEEGMALVDKAMLTLNARSLKNYKAKANRLIKKGDIKAIKLFYKNSPYSLGEAKWLSDKLLTLGIFKPRWKDYYNSPHKDCPDPENYYWGNG